MVGFGEGGYGFCVEVEPRERVDQGLGFGLKGGKALEGGKLMRRFMDLSFHLGVRMKD